MTQVSGQWDGQLTGDAAIAPYGQNDVGVHKGAGVLYDRAVQGVLFRNDTIRVKKTDDTYATCDLSNLLQVTNPAGLTVRVATGGAIGDGLEAYNTANVDFATTDDATAIQAPGGGSNFYRVVLRKDWAAQTIRLAVLDVNVVAPAAVTQVDGTTWEISLATVEITSAAVVTVTDTRRYVPEIHTEMVADEAVTAAKIDNRTRTFFVPPLLPLLDMVDFVGDAIVGVELTAGGSVTVYGAHRVPADYSGAMKIKGIYIASGGAGDLVLTSVVYNGACDEAAVADSDTEGPTTLAAVSTEAQTCVLEQTLTALSAGDFLHFRFNRDGPDVADDYASSIWFLGWAAEYTADS